MIFPIATVDVQGQVKQERLIQGIRALKQLPPGWNGARSPAIDPDAVEHAERFSGFISTCDKHGNNIPLPEVSPLPNGGISLEWTGVDTEGRELVVFFLPDGTMDYVAANDATGFEVAGITREFSELLPHLSWLAHG